MENCELEELQTLSERVTALHKKIYDQNALLTREDWEPYQAEFKILKDHFNAERNGKKFGADT